MYAGGSECVGIWQFKYVGTAVSPERWYAPPRVDVVPGEPVNITISRNADAASMSGVYKVSLPTGWDAVSDVSFPAHGGTDTVTVNVPSWYTAKNALINITPVVQIDGSDYSYAVMSVKAVADFPVENIVSLQDKNLYRSDIDGNAYDIEFIVLGGYSTLIAQYMCVPDTMHNSATDNKYGWLETVGPVGVDGDGTGTITVDPSKMPHGPVCIHLIATGAGGRIAEGYFNYWNAGGTDWKVGLANAWDKATTYQLDMTDWEIILEDDFDWDPAKTYTDYIAQGKRYSINYSNGKDDRWSLFTAKVDDYEVFERVEDSFLKMKTKIWDKTISGTTWHQNVSAPCLNSAHPGNEGGGTWTKGYRDQFLECRVFIPSNPQQWPAFWAMSALEGGGDHNHRLCDELDIMEGWLPATGYHINRHHAWGANPLEPDFDVIDESLSGGVLVEGEKIFGEGIGNFTMGWHTYGCLVKEDATYYYMDDVLVDVERTLPYTYRDGLRFLLNIGLYEDLNNAEEGYGFTRYGLESDMYVDWVRVYNSPAFDGPRYSIAVEDMDLDVVPDGTYTLHVNRVNDDAKSAGQFQVDLPLGWELVGGGDVVSFPSGSGQIEVKVTVPATYVGALGKIKITPCYTGGTPITDHPLLVVNTKNSDNSLGISIYPVINGGTYDVCVEIVNKTVASGLPAGTVTIYNEALGIDMTIPHDALDKNVPVMVTFPNIPLSHMELTNYTFTFLRAADEYEYIFDRPISGLAAVKTNTSIDVTQPFNLSDWEGAMDVFLDYGSGYIFNTDSYIRYDSNYLYFAAVANDQYHRNDETNLFDTWKQDSIQFSIDVTRRGVFTFELGKAHTRYIGAIMPAGNALLGRENDSVVSPDGIIYNFYREEFNQKTYYMMAIPWSAWGIDPDSDIVDIGFSWGLNGAGPGSRYGSLAYMGGIFFGGKEPIRFGDLILTDRNSMEQPAAEPVRLSVSAKAETPEYTPVEFVLSMSNMKNVMNMTVEFEVDGAQPEFKDMEALNGFIAMDTGSGPINWVQMGNGVWKGKLLLMALNDPKNGMTSEAAKEIAKIRFEARALGNVRFKLDSVRVAGLDGNHAPVFVECSIDTPEVFTTVVKVYSLYDIDKNGVVDELDLAMAQYWYQSRESDGNWNNAGKCDVNGDGIVNMSDLIDIVLHFTNRQ